MRTYEDTLRTFYVIRCGWNAANQSSRFTSGNPKTLFDSGYYVLLDVVAASDNATAVAMVSERHTCYSNQHIFAVTNPRSIKGLTREARNTVCSK